MEEKREQSLLHSFQVVVALEACVPVVNYLIPASKLYTDSLLRDDVLTPQVLPRPRAVFFIITLNSYPPLLMSLQAQVFQILLHGHLSQAPVCPFSLALLFTDVLPQDDWCFPPPMPQETSWPDYVCNSYKEVEIPSSGLVVQEVSRSSIFSMTTGLLSRGTIRRGRSEAYQGVH